MMCILIHPRNSRSKVPMNTPMMSSEFSKKTVFCKVSCKDVRWMQEVINIRPCKEVRFISSFEVIYGVTLGWFGYDQIWLSVITSTITLIFCSNDLRFKPLMPEFRFSPYTIQINYQLSTKYKDSLETLINKLISNRRTSPLNS